MQKKKKKCRQQAHSIHIFLKNNKIKSDIFLFYTCGTNCQEGLIRMEHEFEAKCDRFVDGDSRIPVVWNLDFDVYEEIVIDFNVSMLQDL